MSSSLGSKLHGSLVSGMNGLSLSGSSSNSSMAVIGTGGLSGMDNGEEDKESFIVERKKIRSAFELFDRDRKRVVPKEEIGSIMRYLGSYPSEDELISDILPNLSDDEETSLVKLDRFEAFMVRVLTDRMYEPDSEEMILQAFRVLDPENRGYIDEHTMHELLTENEWAFRDKEWEDFMRIAKDPDTNYIHYEDYVGLLQS